MDDSLEQLRRAYRLIRHDRIDEAQAVLRPLLDEDPENIHAWWLMAHASRDPDDIREALGTVLSLDSNYANATKAYELLANLDQRFPSPDDLGDFGDQSFEDDPFAALEDEVFLAEQLLPDGGLGLDRSEEDAYDLGSDSEFQREIFGADVFAETHSAVDKFVVDDEDPFADLETDAFFSEDAESDEAAASALEVADEDLSDLFQIEPDMLEDDDLSIEEETSPAVRRSRRRWIVALPVVLLLIAALIVVLVLALSSGGEAQASDPGPLKLVDVQSDPVTNALGLAQSDLQASGLGSDGRAVVAESKLGNALYVEFCASPGPGLVQSVERGMAIAAQQAAAVESDLPAVGVSVNRCQSAEHDTLYRAVVPAADAVRFASGQLGAEDVGMAAFESYWKTS